MNRLSQTTVSVVIPCYNEGATISRCLKALLNQTHKAFEIIVIDNNSTDDTVKIASSLGAKVISENKQGIIPARNRGMDEASGQILARIDADTEVSPGWIARIVEGFQDSSIQAITGTGDFYDLPFASGSRAFRNLFAVSLNRAMLGHHMLWGSNMAIRGSAWRSISSTLCNQANIMEDLDIAMHLADKYGPKSISYNPAMLANISARRATAGLVKNYLYMKMWPTTLRMHRGRKSHLLWPAVGFTVVVVGSYTSGMFRLYDGNSKSWRSPRKWLVKTNYDRGNP